MRTLVIGDFANGLAADVASVVAAAKSLEQEIDLLIAGDTVNQAADEARKLDGVDSVLIAEARHYGQGLAENLAKLVVTLAKPYSHILASASTWGKDFMPRVAAELDVAMVSDVVRIDSADNFVRPIYAGNAIAYVQSLDPVKVVSVRASAFDAVGQQAPAKVSYVDAAADTQLSQLISVLQRESDAPSLTEANIVVSGGRGVGSAANFALIDELANKLGAAVGSTRAAVDAGFVPNDCQVGQTGKIVAPDLYIAIGISGAIQHVAGIKGAKTIVAINQDPDAPIFQVADYGLVGDLFEILQELIEKL